MYQIDIASTGRNAIWDRYMGDKRASRTDCSGRTIGTPDDGTVDDISNDDGDSYGYYYYYHSYNIITSNVGDGGRFWCSSDFIIDTYIHFFGFVQFSKSIWY